MIEVATNLDLPMKLLWPKSVILSIDNGFTMLGLGDIIVPGLFIAHALRYDFYHSSVKHCNLPYSKPFFTATVSAYVAGLATTMIVMHTFQSAQPALLYLRYASSF
jgi:minor histocompatibility antigen H13